MPDPALDAAATPKGQIAARLRQGIASRLFVLPLLLLAVGLFVPSLDDGFMVDDHFHRARLVGVEEWPWLQASPGGLFDFADMSREADRRLVEVGVMPWWSQDDLSLRLMRPVAGWSHALDFELWPASPGWMHAHSIAWFLVVVAAGWAAYRRILGPSWVAGLAALWFTVEDAHGVIVGWIANRNAVISLAFGLLALLAYDRWRREGWRPGAWWTPLLVALAVLANEGGAAVGAYLLAYGLFLDPAGGSPDPETSRRRWLALLPSTLVGVIWVLVYRGLGYGTHGSSLYVDPGAEPLRFLELMGERLPLLLWGQWAFPGPELGVVLEPSAARVFWWLALGVSVALLYGFLRWLRQDPAARFFALGMVLSLIPACATMPNGRLLFFAGFGAFGLMAQLLARAVSGQMRFGRTLAAVLLVVHLILAPVALVLGVGGVEPLDRALRRAAEGLPADDAIRGQTAVIANAPASFVVAFGPLLQHQAGRPAPRRMVLLSSGAVPTRVQRLDERTLAVRPAGGYLPGKRPAPEPGISLFGRVLGLLDGLYRSDPVQPGPLRQLPDVAVEVAEVTEDGRPAEVRFRFEEPLEHTGYRWLVWQQGEYRAWGPPAVGGEEVLTAPDIH